MLVTGLISAKEYHVAKSGNDQNQGSESSPFLTIQKAADLAQAGDIPPENSDVYALLVEQVVNKLGHQVKETLALDVLDYLSPALRADAAGKNLAGAKVSRPPLAADPDKCTSCGICEECCPVQAVTMDNVPIIGDSCVLCMQCVQHCPEQAFPYDHATTASFIKTMAAASDEDKETTVFV